MVEGAAAAGQQAGETGGPNAAQGGMGVAPGGAKPIPELITLPGVHPEDPNERELPRERMKSPKGLEELTPDPDAIGEEEKAAAARRKADEVPVEDRKKGRRQGGESLGDDPLEDPEKLLQQFRSLQGVHKSLERDAKAGRQAQAELAQMGQRVAQLEAALQQASRPAQQPAAQPTAEKPGNGRDATPPGLVDQLLSTIDWQEYNRITEQYGSEVANLWKDKQYFQALAGHLSDRFTALEKRVDDGLQPFAEERARREGIRSVGELFDQVALSVIELPTGEKRYAYPELLDKSQNQEVVRIWLRAGFPAEFQKNPLSVHTAVALYRDVLRHRELMSQVTGVEAESLEEKPATDAEIRAVAGVTDLGGGAPPAAQTGPLTPRDRILREMRRESPEDRQFNVLGYRP